MLAIRCSFFTSDLTRMRDIISLMEKEKVKPSLLTYKLLIGLRADNHDIEGMERLFEAIEAENIEPDYSVLSFMARHYIYAGLKDKAQTMMKEIEADLKTSIDARIELLNLYGSVGKADEVSRIWKVCEVSPTMNECMAAIEAWGRPGNVKEAEAVFNKMVQNWGRVSSKGYSTMLKVYVKHKLVEKGKGFIERMGSSGNWLCPMTLDAFVRLYVDAGDLEKADSLLQSVTRKLGRRPQFVTLLFLMNQYAKRGDVHNTERLFLTMKQRGYIGCTKPFHALLDAYINAKAPAYGFLERMKAEKVLPTKEFAERVKDADPFRSSEIEDMLLG